MTMTMNIYIYITIYFGHCSEKEILFLLYTGKCYQRTNRQKCPIGDKMHNQAFEIGDWGLGIKDWGLGKNRNWLEQTGIY